MEQPGKIRVCVLTSSRADFGIYTPLLKVMAADGSFATDIVAFGTHLSAYHGHTIDEIRSAGFDVKYSLATLLLADDPGSIASSYALTCSQFAQFWDQHREYDIVLCLGDRFEMAAAVAAGIPMQIRFAHIHAGETTLGAIDNTYRDMISLAASLHFVSLDQNKQRTESLTGRTGSCAVTGALGLDGLKEEPPADPAEFLREWQIDIKGRFVLVTFHPETVSFERNREFAEVISGVVGGLVNKDYHVVATLPNADTYGQYFRSALTSVKNSFGSKIHLVESFGRRRYFACLKHAAFLLGNSSSGIIEAATFGKHVINIGDRQKGRTAGGNVVHVPFDTAQIMSAVSKVEKAGPWKGGNIYDRGGAASIVIDHLKKELTHA